MELSWFSKAWNSIGILILINLCLNAEAWEPFIACGELKHECNSNVDCQGGAQCIQSRCGAKCKGESGMNSDCEYRDWLCKEFGVCNPQFSWCPGSGATRPPPTPGQSIILGNLRPRLGLTFPIGPVRYQPGYQPMPVYQPVYPGFNRGFQPAPYGQSPVPYRFNNPPSVYRGF